MRKFFFYNEIINTALDCFQDDIPAFYSYLKNVVLFGVESDKDKREEIKKSISDNKMMAVLEHYFAVIDEQEKRYKKNIMVGQKGGRPSKLNREELISAIKAFRGYTTINRLARLFECSEKTITRCMPKKEIEKCISRVQVEEEQGRYPKKYNNYEDY